MPRPEALNSSHNYLVGIGRVSSRRKNALVKAFILASDPLEEGGYGIILVGRTRKIVRESAPGHVRRDLGEMARRSADASDIGTCETVNIW